MVKLKLREILDFDTMSHTVPSVGHVVWYAP